MLKPRICGRDGACRGKAGEGHIPRGSQVPGPVTPGQDERSLWDGRVAVTFPSRGAGRLWKMASWLWAQCRAPHSTNEGGQLRKQAGPRKVSRRWGADTCRPQPGGISVPSHTWLSKDAQAAAGPWKPAPSSGSRNPSHVAGEDGGGNVFLMGWMTLIKVLPLPER